MTATSWTDAAATPSQPAGSGLFTSGATVSIDAPASVVFDIITSYSRYSEWNTWTPTLAFEDADGNVAAGAEGRLKTIMKAQNRAYDIPIEVRISLPAATKIARPYADSPCPAFAFLVDPGVGPNIRDAQTGLAEQTTTWVGSNSRTSSNRDASLRQ